MLTPEVHWNFGMWKRNKSGLGVPWGPSDYPDMLMHVITCDKKSKCWFVSVHVIAFTSSVCSDDYSSR